MGTLPILNTVQSIYCYDILHTLRDSFIPSVAGCFSYLLVKSHVGRWQPSQSADEPIPSCSHEIPCSLHSLVWYSTLSGKIFQIAVSVYYSIVSILKGEMTQNTQFWLRNSSTRPNQTPEAAPKAPRGFLQKICCPQSCGQKSMISR